MYIEIFKWLNHLKLKNPFLSITALINFFLLQVFQNTRKHNREKRNCKGKTFCLCRMFISFLNFWLNFFQPIPFAICLLFFTNFPFHVTAHSAVCFYSLNSQIVIWWNSKDVTTYPTYNSTIFNDCCTKWGSLNNCNCCWMCSFEFLY